MLFPRDPHIALLEEIDFGFRKSYNFRVIIEGLRTKSRFRHSAYRTVLQTRDINDSESTSRLFFSNILYILELEYSFSVSSSFHKKHIDCSKNENFSLYVPFKAEVVAVIPKFYEGTTHIWARPPKYRIGTYPIREILNPVKSRTKGSVVPEHGRRDTYYNVFNNINDNDIEQSSAVASWSKSSCLGLALRNSRWFEFSWGKKFSHEISASIWDQCPLSIVMYFEHFWDVLKHQHRARSYRPTSIPLLISALGDEWAAIPQEAFRCLIESMPARVKAVMKAKIGSTPY
ncbi:hypothetical protein ANN_22581 [Periplaneta americana]|uniref:Uncharacterized protein n=1 Tax=Periplaneta americana TaxID=6978 RepID=A0ABQ8S9G4_PERAM|nr:hypothetical protein ANN_22581 [Periplaneta americana]